MPRSGGATGKGSRGRSRFPARAFVAGRLGRPPVPDHRRADRPFDRRPAGLAGGTPLRGARLRAGHRAAAVGAGRTRRHPASAASSAVRQFRLELADHRRPSCHRLLRIARPVLLHARRYAGVAEGLRSAADVQRLRRGRLDRARRQHPRGCLRSRRRVVPDRARQGHGARAVANASSGQHELVGAVRDDAQRPQAGHRLGVARRRPATTSRPASRSGARAASDRTRSRRRSPRTGWCSS